nr:FadR/GntR family transcriptional regulator [Sciscionella marina]
MGERGQGARFAPIERRRAYEQVVERIEQAVFSGALTPGERLPSERELMGQFAVSRSTVREALRVLESNGMVRSSPRDPRGPVILPFSPAHLHKSVTRLASVTELSLAELLQFRMMLEGSASFLATNRLAAGQATAEQLAEIEAAMDDMRAAEGRIEFGRADLAFHDAVARASGNSLVQVCTHAVHTVVLGIIEDKLDKAEDYARIAERTLGHHEQLIEAIRSGQGGVASRIARASLCDYYAEYLPEAERELLRTFAQGS